MLPSFASMTSARSAPSVATSSAIRVADLDCDVRRLRRRRADALKWKIVRFHGRPAAGLVDLERDGAAFVLPAEAVELVPPLVTGNVANRHASTSQCSN
jgi:hypothetical protein